MMMKKLNYSAGKLKLLKERLKCFGKKMPAKNVRIKMKEEAESHPQEKVKRMKGKEKERNRYKNNKINQVNKANENQRL